MELVSRFSCILATQESAMPQVTLYFDETTLRRVERAATLGNVSVSKWVRGRLLRSLEDDWPDGYFDLFGAIQDPSFDRPADLWGPSSLSREKQ